MSDVPPTPTSSLLKKSTGTSSASLLSPLPSTFANLSSGSSIASPFAKATLNSPSPSTRVEAPQTPMHHSHVFHGVAAFEDYQLMDKVGEGTFGEVHKAIHKQTGNLVALKRIIIANHKEGFPITALREIKLLKKLKHPNVISLLDMAISGTGGVGSTTEDYAVYMVFPYMDHDLVGLLDAPGVRFSPPQIKCYIKQLLEGMAYLHKNKILHRDMKSANILMNNRGELKIADFGLARPAMEHRHGYYTGGVVTRWYRPPELLLGATRYGRSIDMWGVGCIIMEILTRKPLFQGQSDLHQLELICRVCGTPTEDTMPGWTALSEASKITLKPFPRRFRELFQHFDRKLLDFLDRLLTLDPTKRMTAYEALHHEYIVSDPPACSPADLPQYPSSHELDKRQRDYKKRKLAEEKHASETAGHRSHGSSYAAATLPSSPHHGGGKRASHVVGHAHSSSSARQGPHSLPPPPPPPPSAPHSSSAFSSSSSSLHPASASAQLKAPPPSSIPQTLQTRRPADEEKEAGECTP